MGKTSWNVLSAASDFGGLVKASGHPGLAVSVYIMDGMLFSSSMRLFRARHALFFDSLVQAGEVADPLDRYRDLVFGIRCKGHGIHNSIPWGLGPKSQQRIG